MTDFWLNHFNVYIKKNQDEPYLLPAYEAGCDSTKCSGQV